MQRLAAVIALVAACATAQTPQNCSFSTLQTCQNTFNTYLGISEPIPWQDAFSYRQKLEALYEKNGIDGVKKVCRGFREMKQCTGTCYQTLLSVPSLVKDGGVDVIHAFVYMSTYNALHYLCGAGFNTYIMNQACFIQTWSEHRLELDQYRRQFEVDAYTNPTMACGLANGLLTRFENAFAHDCGSESRDTQFFGCEYARTSLYTMFPQCSNGCSLPVVG